MGLIAKQLRIEGLVQGVMYRESMGRMARELGVSGWVRNRLDGSVEALVQGEPGAVEEMLQWARLGPPRARVDQVHTDEAEVDATIQNFQRRETA